MGLSRNKVAVPEGVAGTPPFWSVSEGATLEGSGCEGVFSDQSFLHTTVRTTATVRGTLEVQFIDNTERKDQRGKEKQKESLYNLELEVFSN